MTIPLEQAQPASLISFAEMPLYKLSCIITTIQELWTEWIVGLNSQPAVQVLKQ